MTTKGPRGCCHDEAFRDGPLRLGQRSACGSILSDPNGSVRIWAEDDPRMSVSVGRGKLVGRDTHTRERRAAH